LGSEVRVSGVSVQSIISGPFRTVRTVGGSWTLHFSLWGLEPWWELNAPVFDAIRSHQDSNKQPQVDSTYGSIVKAKLIALLDQLSNEG
jgi:hypothetical protein